MRRKWSALTDNAIFSRSRQSVSSGRRLTTARLQQLLVVLLLLTVGMVLWMGNNHAWPGIHSVHIPHPGFTTHVGASAASSSSAGGAAVRQPQTLQKFSGNLEFPLWWHAPFIAQSGRLTVPVSVMLIWAINPQLWGSSAYRLWVTL
jgi:hypothetical protein